MSDATLAAIAAIALSGSLLIELLLTKLGLPGVALVMLWWLFLIPSGLFFGYVLGRTVNAPLWLRGCSTALFAALAASLYLFA